MRLARHVSSMEPEKSVRNCSRHPEVKRQVMRLMCGHEDIVKCILSTYYVRCGLVSFGSGLSPVVTPYPTVIKLVII